MQEVFFKVIDNCAYSDSKSIQKTAGYETYQRRRYKSSKPDSLVTIDVKDIFALKGENVKLYGINPSYIFAKHAEQYCRYYVDNNSLFIENNETSTDYEYSEYSRFYECVFSSSSAKLEKLKIYKTGTHYLDNEKKFFKGKSVTNVIAERIDGAEIKEPSDIDEYLIVS